jgi:tetratricopeptide (TPR) repeat protein
LITLTDSWHDLSQLGSLQSLLNQEILMSDAAMPHDQHQLRTLHALSRRQALMTLAALPAALVRPGADSADGLSPAGGTEQFLARCAASLASCWHLLRGSDLLAVERILSAYLLPLEAAAQQHSQYLPAAARLATQAHRICGILALHRNQLSVREHHCKRALQYAAVTSDASSHASALISLASTYFYASDPQQASAVYEQAFRHGTALPALQRSRVHAELAVVYGQLGREQDAIRAAGQAEELYPAAPRKTRASCMRSSPRRRWPWSGGWRMSRSPSSFPAAATSTRPPRYSTGPGSPHTRSPTASGSRSSTTRPASRSCSVTWTRSRPSWAAAALVTGSTSGIGLAIAQRVARSGYKVTLNYATDDNLAAEALNLCREAGLDTVLVKADISTADGAAALVRQATDAFGRLDVLVNNAARVIDKPALEMTEDDWDHVVDVNLKGAFLCSQHAARQMFTQDDG